MRRNAIRAGCARTCESADGGTEPLRQLVEQIPLILTDPRHVAVRPQQHGWYVDLLADVDDVVDPVHPASDRKPAGLVEQHSAATVHQLVEAPPSRQPHVPQPAAKQFVGGLANDVMVSRR